MNKALFLDRDGTIIKHIPYINNPAKVHLIPEITNIMKKFQEQGYLLIIITNQSGIGRGLITPEQNEKVMKRMRVLLEKQGIKINGVEMCPSHPDENDFRRKPNPGMILDAEKKFNINLSLSIMVGDNKNDCEAGKRAGVGKTFLLADFIREFSK